MTDDVKRYVHIILCEECTSTREDDNNRMSDIASLTLSPGRSFRYHSRYLYNIGEHLHTTGIFILKYGLSNNNINNNMAPAGTTVQRCPVARCKLKIYV